MDQSLPAIIEIQSVLLKGFLLHIVLKLNNTISISSLSKKLFKDYQLKNINSYFLSFYLKTDFERGWSRLWYSLIVDREKCWVCIQTCHNISCLYQYFHVCFKCFVHKSSVYSQYNPTNWHLLMCHVVTIFTLSCQFTIKRNPQKLKTASHKANGMSFRLSLWTLTTRNGRYYHVSSLY